MGREGLWLEGRALQCKGRGGTVESALGARPTSGGSRALSCDPVMFPNLDMFSEKNKGGWKTQERGKHTIKPLPKNGFGPPHL